MLTFADTPWQVFSASAVLLLGILIALWQRKIFRVRISFALSMYAWHTALCVASMIYSMKNISDASSYFIDSFAYIGTPSLGTEAILFLTYILSGPLSLSYAGAFLVFNLFGYIGMLSLAGAFWQVSKGTKPLNSLFVLMFLFLPGLSFWSSAIGKDALTFMGGGLACWAVLNLSRRYPAMIIAFLIILVARPHIAGILAVSFTVTSLLFLRMRIIAKAFLALLTVPLAIAAVIFVMDFTGINDPTSLEAISSRIESQQGQNLNGGSSVSIRDMSIPMRVVTYLFRPMFLDTTGLLGMIVSVENLLLFTIFFVAAVSVASRKSSLSRFQITFLSIFAVTVLLVLANSTANLGIAIRQKWMLLPMLQMLALSVVGQRLKPKPVKAQTPWRRVGGLGRFASRAGMRSGE